MSPLQLMMRMTQQLQLTPSRQQLMHTLQAASRYHSGSS
jgi:hypothetical protein